MFESHRTGVLLEAVWLAVMRSTSLQGWDEGPCIGEVVYLDRLRCLDHRSW